MFWYLQKQPETSYESNNPLQLIKPIGHLRVPKPPNFKMRPIAQPFLWKRVLFAWLWKIVSMSKAEHFTSFWYTGSGDLGNGLLCAHLISSNARILDPRAQAFDSVRRIRMQLRKRWILRIRFRDQSVQRAIRHRPNLDSALPQNRSPNDKVEVHA